MFKLIQMITGCVVNVIWMHDCKYRWFAFLTGEVLCPFYRGDSVRLAARQPDRSRVLTEWYQRGHLSRMGHLWRIDEVEVEYT